MLISRATAPRRQTSPWIRWLMLIVVLSWVERLSTVWLGTSVNGRLTDVLSLLLRTLFWIMLCAGLAFVLSRWLKQDVQTWIEQHQTWFFWLLAPAVLDGVFMQIGWMPSASWPFLNPSQALGAWLSLGWWPHQMYSLGAQLALSAVVVQLFLSLRQQARASMPRSLLASYGGGLALALPGLVPSLVSWIGWSDQTPVWSADSQAVWHGFLSNLNQSYWSKNVYERFPIAWGSEGMATAWLVCTAFAWVTLGLAAGIFFRARCASWLRPVRAYLDLPSAVLLIACLGTGWTLALLAGATWTWNVFYVSAGVLFIFAWSCLEIWRQTCSQSEPASIESRPVYLALGLVAAALLGWPVFFCALVFASLGYVQTEWLEEGTLWSILSAALQLLAAVIGAWFFLIQHSTLSAFQPGLAFGLLAFFATQEVLRTGPAGPRLSAWSKRKEVRFALGALGFCLLPVLSHITPWWWLVAPAVGLLAYGLFYARRPSCLRFLPSIFLFASSLASWLYAWSLHQR